MTIDLTDNERDTLILALGMAAAMAMRNDLPKAFKGIRLIMGKLSPDSYWALKPEDAGEED